MAQSLPPLVNSRPAHPASCLPEHQSISSLDEVTDQRAAIKTQRNRRGNTECSAMLVVVVVMGEGLLEEKCVCVYVCVLFNGV